MMNNRQLRGNDWTLTAIVQRLLMYHQKVMNSNWKLMENDLNVLEILRSPSKLELCQ